MNKLFILAIGIICIVSIFGLVEAGKSDTVTNYQILSIIQSDFNGKNGKTDYYQVIYVDENNSAKFLELQYTDFTITSPGLGNYITITTKYDNSGSIKSEKVSAFVDDSKLVNRKVILTKHSKRKQT